MLPQFRPPAAGPDTPRAGLPGYGPVHSPDHGHGGRRRDAFVRNTPVKCRHERTGDDEIVEPRERARPRPRRARQPAPHAARRCAARAVPTRPPRRSADPAEPAAESARRGPGAGAGRAGSRRRRSSRTLARTGFAIAGGAATLGLRVAGTRGRGAPRRGRHATLSGDRAHGQALAGWRLLAPRLRGERHRDGGDGRLQPDARASSRSRCSCSSSLGQVLQSADVEASDPSRPAGALPVDRAGHAQDALDRVRTSSTEIGIVAIVAGLWIGASFWGAMDTAFCRIYHVECRGWCEQKRFSLIMLVVVAFFLDRQRHRSRRSRASSSPAPTTSRSASDASTGSPTSLLIGGGLMISFGILCLIYWAVPKGHLPWRGVWPGALFVTIARRPRQHPLPRSTWSTSRRSASSAGSSASCSSR